MTAMRKKLNIFKLQLPIYYIRIGNINWCKCEHCNNEPREIDCPWCRQADATPIASAKILVREGGILPSSLYGQVPNY